MNEMTATTHAPLPAFCARCGLVEAHEVHHGRRGEFSHGEKIAAHKFKKSVDAGARLICPEDRPSEPAVGRSDSSSSERRDSPAKARTHDPRCTSLKGEPWGCNCWAYRGVSS